MKKYFHSLRVFFKTNMLCSPPRRRLHCRLSPVGTISDNCCCKSDKGRIFPRAAIFVTVSWSPCSPLFSILNFQTVCVRSSHFLVRSVVHVAFSMMRLFSSARRMPADFIDRPFVCFVGGLSFNLNTSQLPMASSICSLLLLTSLLAPYC